MRHVVAALAALTLAATVASCADGRGGNGAVDDSSAAAPIRIGLVISDTGSQAPLAGEARKAVGLAADQLNAKGGVLGRKVEVLYGDDRTLPDEAVLAFEDLAAKDVVAVIGPVFPDAARAVEPIAQREGVPYLSLAPAGERAQPIRSYVFDTPAPAWMYAERYLRYLRSERLTKVAVAYDRASAYAVAGHTAVDELGARYGVQVVADEAYEATTTDFDPILTRAGDSGADALLFWGTGEPGVTVTRQYAASGLRIPLLLTGSQAGRLWLDPVGTAVEGVIVQSTIGVVGDQLPAGPQKAIIDQLAVPYEQQHGHAPSQVAQDGYSAALLLFEAIKRAGGTDRERIRTALESTTLLTPNGRYRFSPADHFGLSPDYISVNTVSDGRFVPTGWAKEQLAKTVTGR
ncbi:MAG: ABC transporter substrate-binding protein [Actinomadura sp.]